MVWGVFINGHTHLVIFRDVKTPCQVEKPIVDFNSLFFGMVSIGSLAIFFYFGRFKASRRQLEREDRIDWTTRKFSLWKIFIYSVAVVSAFVLIEYLF